MRRRLPGALNTTRQLATAIAGFIIVILMIESGGLATWAERLNVGPGRTVAVRLTAAWQRVVRPLGIERLRASAIANLQKVGWSEDAAEIAETTGNAKPVAPPSVSPAAPPAAPPSTIEESGNKPKPKPSPVAVEPKISNFVPLPAPPIGRPRVVALVGDSMMKVGLSYDLLQETAHRKDLKIVQTIHSGTGLARPEVFNWMKQYPAMLKSAHPDIVIVAIGANDTQGFVENGKTFKFGTDEWIEVYRQRLSDFLDLLVAEVPRIMWISLPPMKQAGYNRKIEEINRIAHDEVSARPQISWLNSALYIGDAKGNFREFLTSSDGKIDRIRMADGIHLSDKGAALLTAELMRWINAP
jgi:uncharacterized protein